MKGLSITAIGQRPIQECISIYRQLEEPLGLQYLELAVGANCELTKIPKDIPLVIHNRCLYQDGMWLPFSLLNSSTWDAYKTLLNGRNVLALSIHPPKLVDSTAGEIIINRALLSETLGLPVMLEVMPSPAYWLSQQTLLDEPLLLDISHINIWCQGNYQQVATICASLLHRVKGIHLSHNNGRKDSHDLIPNDIWFEPLINTWSKDLLVTYESLPKEFAKYQRLDKKSV